MNTITSVTLEVPDPEAAEAFYAAAFGLESRLHFRAAEAETTGFRGFTLSLVVAQPATVDGFVATAIGAGATPIKPVKASLWGYGGTLRAPDGTIWKVATSKKKASGPATRQIDDIVLLLGVLDVPATRRFYVERGLTVKRSFARSYVEFDTANVKLGFYKRRALAKDAGVAPDGGGSHRISIAGDAGAFTDPDGFRWEAAPPAVAPGRPEVIEVTG